MLRKRGIRVIGGLLVLVLALAGAAQGRNPDLSFWTRNLSGDEPPGEKWNDLNQEIAVSGNFVHLTYWAVTPACDRVRLYYRRSTDGGQTWEPKILLYDSYPYGSTNSWGRGWKYLAFSGPYVYIIYSQYDPYYGSWILVYLRSANNGATFGIGRNLGVACPQSRHYLAAHQNRLTIVWQAKVGDNWYLRTANSFDYGITFSYRDLASAAHLTPVYYPMDVQRWANRIYIFYRDSSGCTSGKAKPYLATSLDGGNNFVITALSAYEWGYSGGLCYRPKIALVNDLVYVVFQDLTLKNSNPYPSLVCRRSTDQGLTFDPPVPIFLDEDSEDGQDLREGWESIAASGTCVFVAFGYGNRVWFSHSVNSGVSFSAPSEEDHADTPPALALDPLDPPNTYLFYDNKYKRTLYYNAGYQLLIDLAVMPRGYSWIGCQAVCGPDGFWHLTVDQDYGSGSGDSDYDIFYRRLTPAPPPTAARLALRIYTDPDERRYDQMLVANSLWFYANITTQLSGEIWVKPYPGGAAVNLPEKQKYICGKGAGLGSYSFNLRTQLYDPDDQSRRVAAAEITTQNGSFALRAGPDQGLVPDNAWTHLAFTYEATAPGNNFKLYKNGQLIAATRATGRLAMSESPLAVGGWGRWDLTELRLWNRALSQSEIQANMFRTLMGNEAGLIAYWPFGNTTRDQTGHGHDGVLIYKETFGPADLPCDPSAINLLLLQ